MIFVGDAAKEYGFTDVDGRYIENFYRAAGRLSGRPSGMRARLRTLVVRTPAINRPELTSAGPGNFIERHSRTPNRPAVAVTAEQPGHGMFRQTRTDAGMLSQHQQDDPEGQTTQTPQWQREAILMRPRFREIRDCASRSTASLAS